MHNLLAIVRFRLKSNFTSPAVWVLMIAMPFIFSVIFGSLTGDSAAAKPRVELIADNGASAQLVKLITANAGYNWHLSADLAQAKLAVTKQKAVAAVRIPSDIADRIGAKKPLLQVYVQRKSSDYQALNSYLQGVSRTVMSAYQLAGSLPGVSLDELLQGIVSHSQVQIRNEPIGINSQSKPVNLTSVGFTIMFMMFGISAAASAILDERREGTWSRLLVTPASRLQIMGGYLLSYFLLGWVQFGVLMTAMALMFHVHWGNPVLFIPFASLMILTIVGFGLMMAGIVKTRRQASALSALVIVSTCMLGGVYWPLDFVPQIMRTIAQFVPQSWAMEGFRQIMGGSLYVPDLVRSCLALSAFAAVFFFIGLRRIRFE